MVKRKIFKGVYPNYLLGNVKHTTLCCKIVNKTYWVQLRNSYTKKLHGNRSDIGNRSDTGNRSDILHCSVKKSLKFKLLVFIFPQLCLTILVVIVQFAIE